MARCPNTTPLRGILRDTDRNVLQSFQQRTATDSQQVNPHDKEKNYSFVNEANMPIFADAESSIPSSSFKSGVKSHNINADLYAQAMAAKSNLGLLDTTPFSSSLAALQDYGNFKSHSSQKKLLTSPFQSMRAHNVLPHSPASQSSVDLQNEMSLSYKNTNTEQSTTFKSIMDLNLNTVEDEDEFLYGEANILPDIASFNQGVDFNTQTNSTDAYMSDDELQGIEAPNFGNPLSSVEGKSNISTWKKASGWDIKDGTVNSSVNINTVKPCEKEPSLISKQYKVDSETHCYSPLEQNSNDYNKLSMLYYKSQEKTRQGQYPEASFELLKTTPTAFASYANNSLSPPNFFTFLSDNKNTHISSNLLKKQPNNDRAAKNGSIYQDKMNYENVVDKTKYSYEHEESVNKSASKESVNFPKLLINLEQDKISTRRTVHVNSPSKLENQPSSYNNVRMKNFQSINEVLQSKTTETRRVACNELKNNITKIASLDHKDEADSVNLNNDIRSIFKHSLETNKKEQISNVVSDKYSVKQGDKSRKQRSPEKLMSLSCGSRGRSPESIRRRSPGHRYRSRDYSPYYRDHDRSPHRSHDSSRYRPRDHSPRYHSRESPDRGSPGHSSRSRERSPRRRNRYHSRGRSPRHSSLEKRSYSPQDQSPVQYPSSEKCSRLKGNTSPEPITKNALKRTHVLVCDELTDKPTSSSVRKVVNSLEEKLGGHTGSLSETISKNSDEIAFKRGKIDDTEGVFQNPLHSSENNMNTFKIISNSSVTVQSLNKSEIQLDLPKADTGFSTNDKDLNVATITSWAATTRPPVPVSASPQLNIPNTLQYGISYPQQTVPILPHMYPQYSYETPSVLPLPPDIFYSPMVPPPVSTTTPFTYPPMPTSTSKASNIHRCLKPIPIANSVENINLPKSEATQSQSQEDPPDWSTNQSTTAKLKNKVQFRMSVLRNLPKSETTQSQYQEDPPELSKSKPSTAKLKNKTSHMQKDSIERKGGLVQRYRNLLKERDIMLKTLRNTSDHTVEIRNLKMEMESKVKSNTEYKFLLSCCAKSFENANEKLNSYIEKAKRLNADVKKLQSKINPKFLQFILPSSEKTQKQIENTLVSYVCFDMADHWCAECNEKFASIPKVIEHLHQKTHLQHEDPFKIVTSEPVKEATEKNKNALFVPVKGVEFIKPLSGFYCSLCEEPLVNQSYAEKHVRGTNHMINYKNFLLENPVYEEKRRIFKKIATLSSRLEGKQKIFKAASKCLIQENQKFNAEALKKMPDDSQEKLPEKLEESNINVQNQKEGGVKLKLTNEKTKSLETNTIKVPDAKPKQTVVYIGRAPNYKPRNKSNDKNSFLEKKKKAIVEKVEEQYDYDSFYAVSEKPEKQSCAILQPLDSVSLDSKNLDSLPISKISVHPKGIEENEAKDISCEKEPKDISCEKEPIETELDESDKIKQVVCLKRNETVAVDCLSKAEANKLDSESASNKSDNPIEHQTNEHFMNEAPKNTMNEISISQGVVNLSEIELPLETSFPEKNIEIPNAAPEPKRRNSLTEEEKDFLLLNIDKSDMEPIAVPRPPPSVLIQTHSDVAKLPPFPPPLQVPPPNIVSQVPPPNIAPFVPPPNIISNIPPPNIAAQIPPPNIAAQIPPPSIASNLSSPDIVVPTCNFTSEQKHFDPVFFTETSILSHKIYPSVFEQPQTHILPKVQNTDVIDMEIENTDEIEFGPDYLIENEGIPCSVKPSDNVSVSTQSAVVPIIEELPASSLSSVSLITTESYISPTSTIAPIVLEENEIVKHYPMSTTPEQENENDFSEVVIDKSNGDDDKIMLTELLSLLMDAVAANLKDSDEDKDIHNKKVQVSELFPIETTESSDSRNDQSNSICIDPEREDFERADNPNNFHVVERTVIDDKSDEMSNGSLTEKCYNMNWKLTTNSSDDQNNNSDGLLNERHKENATKASSRTVSSKGFTLSQNTSEEMPELTGEILNAVISITNDDLNHSFAYTTEFHPPEHIALSTAQEGNEMDTDIYVEECSINQKLSDGSSNSYSAANAENSNERLFDSLSSFSNFVDSLKNKELKKEINSTEQLNDCSPNFLNYRNGGLVNKDSENEGISKDISPETVYLKVENTSTNVILPQNRKESIEITGEMQNNSTVPFCGKITQSSNGTLVNSLQKGSTSLKNKNKLVENKEVDDDLEIIAEYDCCYKSLVKRKKRRSVHEIVELDSEPEEMEVKENPQGIPCVNFTCISKVNNDEKLTSSFINLCSQRSIIKEQHISAFKEMEALTSTPTTSEKEKMHVNQKAYNNTSKRNESFDEKPLKSLDNTQEIFMSKEINQIVKNNESFLNSNEKLLNKDFTCQEKVNASVNEMPHGKSSITYVNSQFEQNHSDNLCIKQENVTSSPCEPENENNSSCFNVINIKDPEMILMQSDSVVSSLEPSNTDKEVQHAQNLEISNEEDMHYHNELSPVESSGSSNIVTTYGENVKFVIKKEETIRNEVIMHSNFRDSKERTAAEENRTPGCKNVSSKPLPFIKVEIKSEETAELFMNETTEIGGYIATPHFPLKTEIKEKNDSCMGFFDESMQQNLTHSLDKGFTVVTQKCFQGSTSHFNESKALEILNDNSQELKREVSVPLLKKYDTDEILSDMSADGPPILSERDESSSQHNKKEPKDSDSVTKADSFEAEENEQKKKERKNNSDTDEYETED
ncbi:zinc finger protein 318 [Trichonephila inaurata madagascariensis]|uniref:Zinc finger protein 318 n=1 Tax=Trichonephila inaurata madagascariensis TaxID=2747483 RepID=A0A8X6YFI7_9ARAC|nr:zinc finger protein 318 [Trichonephila inaurata madagascariensis]